MKSVNSFFLDFLIQKAFQKETVNSVELNRVEHVFRSYKISVNIFIGVNEWKSKENHIT